MDYEEFGPININANSTEFNLVIIDDDIAMETNESIILSFMSHESKSILEPVGEYVRNLATVNIMDNDCKFFLSLCVVATKIVPLIRHTPKCDYKVVIKSRIPNKQV